MKHKKITKWAILKAKAVERHHYEMTKAIRELEEKYGLEEVFDDDEWSLSMYLDANGEITTSRSVLAELQRFIELRDKKPEEDDEEED
jgi:hypothetical protein